MVRKIGKGFGYREEIALARGRQCASINGFNLHAATYVSPFARDRLENLISYLTRPLVAVERLTRRDDGDLVYRMKRLFADGTEAIVLSPSELLERLSAMVPPPRAHQILYTGVFSSHSRWRQQVVLDPSAREDVH